MSNALRNPLSISLHGATIALSLFGKGAVLLDGDLRWIRLRYVDFVPRTTDIFIVTYPRSGTTWLQMILYQLSSDGNIDFAHISEKIPWFERLALYGRDVREMADPRIFKTHLPYSGWQNIPKGPCKYIYVMRNGRDVAVSYFHFYRTHLGYKGNFSQFFNLFVRGRVQYGSWFRHVAGWLAHRRDPNVLFVRYEELRRDLEGSVRKIADFLGFGINNEQLPRILERCSFDFMKEHERKFDHINELLWERGLRSGSFMRKGKTGQWRSYFNTEQERLFQIQAEKWFGGYLADQELIC